MECSWNHEYFGLLQSKLSPEFIAYITFYYKYLYNIEIINNLVKKLFVFNM